MNQLDLTILAIYISIVFWIGLKFTRDAGKSTDHFFVANRGLPWWILGVSMAATNYSIDTPLAITKLVSTQGIAGVWFWWAGALSALLVAFLFSRLWRRAGVVTDAEIVELRYGGRSAAALRLFKGFYFGIFFNVFIMAWVFLALHKVIAAMTDLPTTPLLVVGTLLAFIYTVASGIYGVIITDLFQYGLAAIGAILIAYYSVAHVGGLEALWTKLETAPEGLTSFTAFSDEGAMLPSSVFLTYICVKWWAHKWADGGGKHIQRMLSARDERHAMWATIFFAVNATLVVWPWIMTALSAYVELGVQEDPEMGYPMMMKLALPHGVLGLAVACLAGAFMSTIDTHLNLGASYVINDLYRRFWKRDETEKHYVLMARVTMGLMLALSVVVSMNMESVANGWKFLITFASGAGVTWILRWFWWRLNAWTEISAMLASGVIATYLKLSYPELLLSYKILACVLGSAMIWLPVTLLTAPVPAAHLADFVRRVRPGTFGWKPIYQLESMENQPYLLKALILWVCAVIILFGANFLIGSLLLGRF